MFLTKFSSKSIKSSELRIQHKAPPHKLKFAFFIVRIKTHLHWELLKKYKTTQEDSLEKYGDKQPSNSTATDKIVFLLLYQGIFR